MHSFLLAFFGWLPPVLQVPVFAVMAVFFFVLIYRLVMLFIHAITLFINVCASIVSFVGGILGSILKVIFPFLP
jgi:Predicted membrane protein